MDLIKDILELQKQLSDTQKKLDDKKAALRKELESIGLGEIPFSEIKTNRNSRITLPAKTSAKAPSSPAKASKPKAKGKRGSQGETILKALADKKLKTGELSAEINYSGANLSAVLAGMKKANKIDKDKDGLWFVIKK